MAISEVTCESSYESTAAQRRLMSIRQLHCSTSPERPQVEWAEVRLWAWAMRSMHSACRRRDPSLVCHSRVGGRNEGDRHAGGARHATTSSPDPGSLHQGASRAVWILHERRNPDREGVSRQESQSDRRTDSAGLGQRTVPVWNASGNYPGCEARSPRPSQDMKPISRRQFVRKGRDALIVGFSLHSGISPAIAWSQIPPAPTPSAKPVVPGRT